MPSSCISSCISTIDSLGKPEAAVVSFVTLPCSAETECLTEPGDSWFFPWLWSAQSQRFSCVLPHKAGIVGLYSDFYMVLGSEFPPSWMCSQHSYICPGLGTCFFFSSFFIIIVILNYNHSIYTRSQRLDHRTFSKLISPILISPTLLYCFLEPLD